MLLAGGVLQGCSIHGLENGIHCKTCLYIKIMASFSMDTSLRWYDDSDLYRQC